jgi:hypothetical protein
MANLDLAGFKSESDASRRPDVGRNYPIQHETQDVAPRSVKQCQRSIDPTEGIRMDSTNDPTLLVIGRAVLIGVAILLVGTIPRNILFR